MASINSVSSDIKEVISVLEHIVSSLDNVALVNNDSVYFDNIKTLLKEINSDLYSISDNFLENKNVISSKRDILGV